MPAVARRPPFWIAAALRASQWRIGVTDMQVLADRSPTRLSRRDR